MQYIAIDMGRHELISFRFVLEAQWATNTNAIIKQNRTNRSDQTIMRYEGRFRFITTTTKKKCLLKNIK